MNMATEVKDSKTDESNSETEVKAEGSKQEYRSTIAWWNRKPVDPGDCYEFYWGMSNVL